MARRVPPLWRAGRILRRLGLVAVVFFVLFVVSAVYFATEVHPDLSEVSHPRRTIAGNNTLELTAPVNLSNPGIYSLTGVSVSTEARLVDGTLLATGGSPTMTIAPGASVTIPISIFLPLKVEDGTLLTHDQQLPVTTWANATYASIFTVRLEIQSNQSWGAPFFGFNATPGTPSLQSNGSVLESVAIQFQNHASFDIVGLLALTILSSAGSTCSATQLDVNAPAGQGYSQNANFYLSSGCNPAGGSVEATYSGGGLTYAFPPEAIP
jgi:hypothetical protein